MKKKSEWLLDFQGNVFSQAGEDGIIRKILEILPDKNKWCVEFGAWDGVYLSNVRNLIENDGYSGVLIEASKDKYVELIKNSANYENVITLNAFVGFSETDNLDVLLESTPIPENFDLLSVDVDGNDYHIWKAVSKYKPKLVVIEFNQTIPTEIAFVQEANPTVSQGSSLLALVELGKEKGYELVSVLPFNAFFVKSEYFPLLEIEDNSPLVLRKSLEDVTYIFSGYDGKVFLQGSQQLPWHGIRLKQSSIQPLPAMLHKFPSNYNKIEHLVWMLYLLMQRFYEQPMITIKKIITRITRGCF